MQISVDPFRVVAGPFRANIINDTYLDADGYICFSFVLGIGSVRRLFDLFNEFSPHISVLPLLPHQKDIPVQHPHRQAPPRPLGSIEMKIEEKNYTSLSYIVALKM